MHRLGIHGSLVAWLAVMLAPTASADDAEGMRFFEQKIRPVLVKECYSCHSAGAKKVRGGLLLDTRAGVLAGGDSGPAVVPGKTEESPLIEALRHDGLEMPPKSKLPDAVIADFERWVNLGAPDPRDGKPAPVRAGIDVEAGRKFWSYQPPKRHKAPAVADAAWPRTDIDRFVLAALEKKGLRPVADADRATLARRLAYDLTGLPPSPEEIDAFANDRRPDAYERLVDRLLASPRFGERWGRHWLDVARFGESLTLRGMVFKEAWRYRDYVIDAFNEDMRFDRFIEEQVAGDLLPASSTADRRRQRIATTFLVLGNNNLEEQDKPQLRMDVVDEQIETIGKAFLAQTIACARCHDHKFDPIPTKDYYAIAGILRNAKALEDANVSKWLELPLPAEPEREATLKRHDDAVAALEVEIKKLRAEAGATKASGVLATGDLPGVVIDDAQARKVGAWSTSRYSGNYIGTGYSYASNNGQDEKTLTFQPDLPAAGLYEVRLAYVPHPNRSKAAPVTVFSADGDESVTIDMQAEPPIDGRFATLGRHRFEKNGQGFVLVTTAESMGTVVVDAVQFLPVDSAADAVVKAPTRDAGASPAAGKKLKGMEAELKKLKASGPKRDLAMSVVEESQIVDIPVHVRGSVHNLGEPAPRGFLRVASYGPMPAMPSGESGRRELAGWIAGEANPLTARVIVNRAWHWLFGAGLVRTVDNFGTTGETPSHPELLDDLAVRFMQEGWSIKALVRGIVVSHAYRLAVVDAPKGRAADPENRLLWRMNRRRLDAECIRDTILEVSGALRDDMGGSTFPPTLNEDYGYQLTGARRSVYAPVFRNALPDLFEVFDFADPSMVVGRRNVSTVAPQALLLMNHPFLIEQSRLAARRLLAGPEKDDASRIDRAYRVALGRKPSGPERRLALKFLATAEDAADGSSANPEDSWALLFQTLFASIDFRYVD